MPITAEQREQRRNYVGSSDIAAILGFDPYRNAYDVFMEKVHGTEDIENEAADIGNMVEEPLVKWAAIEHRLHDELLLAPPTVIHPNGIMATNFDGLVPYTVSFESKYTSIGEEWGDPGTDEIPDRVIAQTNFGFACLPTLEYALVPALIGKGNRLSRAIYRVETNKDIINGVTEAAVRFMDNVRKQTPPDSAPPSMDTLKRIRREDGVEVEIDDALVEKWLTIKASIKGFENGLKKQEEEAKAAVIAALGAGTVGVCSLGRFIMQKVERKGFTVEPTSYYKSSFKET